MHSHSKGTGFGTCTRACVLIVDRDSDESQCDKVAVDGEQVVKKITGTTSVVTEPLYRVFIVQASFSLDSGSTSEDDDDDHSGLDLQTQQACVALLPSNRWEVKHHINDSCTPLSFSCCISQRLSHCLWWQLRDYYHWCMDSVDEGCSPQPDITEAEMFVFRAVGVQIGLRLWDQLIGYWAKSGTVLHSILQ